MMTYRYMFLRDTKRAPIGCVAIKAIPDSDYIQYQISVVNPIELRDQKTGKSVAFNRECAKELALGRLADDPFTVIVRRDERTMYGISKAVMTNIATFKVAPTRAWKAAKNWLKTRGSK